MVFNKKTTTIVKVYGYVILSIIVVAMIIGIISVASDSSENNINKIKNIELDTTQPNTLKEIKNISNFTLKDIEQNLFDGNLTAIQRQAIYKKHIENKYIKLYGVINGLDIDSKNNYYVTITTFYKSEFANLNDDLNTLKILDPRVKIYLSDEFVKNNNLTKYNIGNEIEVIGYLQWDNWIDCCGQFENSFITSPLKFILTNGYILNIK